MCGIVAVINKYQNGFIQKQLDVFESLLYIDGLRGMDSTGVIKIDNDGKFLTLKGAVEPPKFLAANEWSTVRREAYLCGSALIGHNRKATKGIVNDDNAHPFVINDELALVHNGTLMGDHRKYANVDVDSHAIAHYLHEHGVQASVNELNAAYCFFWYDHRTKSAHLLRNNERPMFWMETDDAIYYASEFAFLDFVKTRHSLKILKDGIREQPEFVLSTFKLEDKSWEITSSEIKKPTRPLAQRYFSGSSQKWTGGSYVGGYADELTWPDVDLEKPVVTPITQPSTRAPYDQIVAENNKIFCTNKEMTTFLEESRKITKTTGILVDFNYNNLMDRSDGYTLYFSALDENEPYLYTLKVSQTDFKSVDEINKMITEGVIYSLIPKSNRHYSKINTDFGFLTIPCVSGKEISKCESTIYGEANVH